MKITLDYAKNFFKSWDCNWFYICRETNMKEELDKLNIPKELYDKWTWEYLNEKIDKLDYSRPYKNIIYDLKGFTDYNLSYELAERIYNIFLNLYNETNSELSHSYSTMSVIIKEFINFNEERPFGGLLGYFYNDKEKVKILSEILIKQLKFEDEFAFKYFLNFALYSLYYEYDYSKELHNIFIDRSKEKYDYSLEYGEDEWPMICYLGGYVVEKNYVNAYRAIRMVIEKYDKVSENSISKIKMVNKITKMNYTLEDVLKLPPLRESYKKSDLDIFTENFLRKERNK